MSGRKRVAFAMSDSALDRIFPAERLAAVAAVADIAGHVSEFGSASSRRILGDVDVLITGWGSPRLDTDVLDAIPNLEAVLHSAGTVKPYLAEEVLLRGVQVSTAAAANAVPVAEYTVAMIVLAAKRVLPLARRYREERREIDVERDFPGLGAFDKRVGIIGASTIGRLVVRLLRSYRFEVVVYDPYLDDDGAAALGVELVGLDDLLATSDVVSVHAPSLPSTWNLVDARGIERMRTDATLINTARGEIIDQAALTRRVLAGELYAILDVTSPWILDPAHPLYTSGRALLTPHIAGSYGTELGRLAESVLEELVRLTDGRALAHRLSPARFAVTA
ncbi:phosphoglycerate dehydrogenase-like enzyme [Rathayibacter sp. PhB93]|uniref:hydroxyacid dehydrogenase n=1 Tax=unclassified Rathayibacter TaxID=2609250 RepID=UPI000F9CB6E2|nr:MULTISPECIES: hydroxyacid dehydrogenase [unclassified Rathayibacter]ROQ05600.1 phosphoglycerate dehydrogenase-like enzyme [Rathayibacter sp. PhB93]TDQ12329.1 phosphoglycerate dehydrogenase-like enzyme [Rathayibacter sp. PhB1]